MTVDAVSDRPALAPIPRHAAGSAEPTPVWVLAVLAVLGSSGLVDVCWVSGHVHADPILQTAARFLHVAALVVGLGAVLAVDWFAALWLLGRRALPDVLTTARTLQVPIWLGLAGLLVTGLFLQPHLESPLTRAKVCLVLAITLNGLYAHWLAQRLEQHKGADVPCRLLLQSGAATALSQIGWWGATLIGFVNSHS